MPSSIAAPWLAAVLWGMAASAMAAEPAAAAGPPLVAWQGETMGSAYTVKIAGTNLAPGQVEAIKQAMDARLREVNRQMSHYLPDSELSRFNRSPAGQPFVISADFASVLRLALEMDRLSQGAFDPTLGPVINLWGFGEKTSVRRTPSDDQLREALSATGARHLSLEGTNRLSKDIPGLSLNLSAIAKGFGVDAMADLLRQRGLTNFYVSISGEVFASGQRPDGHKWRVGVSAPILDWRAGDPLAGVLLISGLAVSTSGDYQKFFFDPQGRRLCHIFDPRTGRPVQHALGGVTVVADNCTLADALSTTLFVLGPEEGPRFIETRTNAAALFIVRQPDGAFRQQASSRFAALTGYKE